MKNQLSSIENSLMKLTFKQQNFIYTIARLEYRIWKALTNLEIVKKLIDEEKTNIISLNPAITAAGKGKVADKLMVWKTKAEYKLFKLNLRKNKIDIVKLILNQSKLAQIKQTLIALEADMKKIDPQKSKLSPINKIKTETNIVNRIWESEKQTSIKQSINVYLKDALKMAS